MEDVDEPHLTVSGAARRLGIAPATLRTWDRRYGIGPSGHARGRHRRYSAADMARLELMQRALMQGAAPAEAARYARTSVSAPRPGSALAPPATAEDGMTTPDRADRPGVLGAVVPPPPVLLGRGGGGASLRMPGAGPRARGLGRAALAMDPTAVQPAGRGLDRHGRAGRHVGRGGAPGAGRDRGPLGGHRSWRGGRAPAQPVPHRGVRHPDGAAVAPADPVPAPTRPVLLAAMPTELHVVPLAVLAALLAERGVGCRSLGAALPADALAAAVRRTAPAAVVLWSQLPVDGRPDRRHRAAGDPPALPDLRRRPRLGRRRAAGGGGRARAPSSMRASGSAPPFCGDPQPVAVAVSNEPLPDDARTFPSEDRRAVGSPRWLTSTGAVMSTTSA